jgi:predicted  nucleic acid-binding Zn-ribbon protein
MNNKICNNCKEYKELKIENDNLKEKIAKLELTIININVKNDKLKTEIEELKLIHYDSVDEYFKD